MTFRAIQVIGRGKSLLPIVTRAAVPSELHISHRYCVRAPFHLEESERKSISLMASSTGNFLGNMEFSVKHYLTRSFAIIDDHGPAIFSARI
jgi:hypothetical protein